MINKLQLKDPIYIRKSYQKVGNCTVANTDSMELALLFMQLSPLIGDTAAKDLANAIYKGRTKDSRLGLLEDYLNRHRLKRQYPLDKDLITQIYYKETSDRDTDLRARTLLNSGPKGEKLDIPGAEWH